MLLGKLVGFLTCGLIRFNPIFIPHDDWYLSLSLTSGGEEGVKHAPEDSPATEDQDWPNH